MDVWRVERSESTGYVGADEGQQRNCLRYSGPGSANMTHGSHTEVQAVWCCSPSLDDSALGLLMLALLSSKIYKACCPHCLQLELERHEPCGYALCASVCFQISRALEKVQILNLLPIFQSRTKGSVKGIINLSKLGTLFICEVSLPDKIGIL